MGNVPYAGRYISAVASRVFAIQGRVGQDGIVLTVRYFAAARAAAGVSEEKATAPTLAALRRSLAAARGQRLERGAGIGQLPGRRARLARPGGAASGRVHRRRSATLRRRLTGSGGRPLGRWTGSPARIGLRREVDQWALRWRPVASVREVAGVGVRAVPVRRVGRGHADPLLPVAPARPGHHPVASGRRIGAGVIVGLGCWCSR